MSNRPRGDPGWAWYEREVARLETALAKEREKKERLRTALERIGNVGDGARESYRDKMKGGIPVTAGAMQNVARAALASTGSEADG